MQAVSSDGARSTAGSQLRAPLGPSHCATEPRRFAGQPDSTSIRGGRGEAARRSGERLATTHLGVPPQRHRTPPDPAAGERSGSTRSSPIGSCGSRSGTSQQRSVRVHHRDRCRRHESGLPVRGPAAGLDRRQPGLAHAVVRRPKPSQSRRRRIFEGAELEQTIRAAKEPWRTLFTVAALTGARVSELLALTWADVRLGDLDETEVRLAWQVDRKGVRRPTKTDGSARTVPLPRELAVILIRHKLASRFAGQAALSLRRASVRRFVSAMSSALRIAQRDAVDDDGRRTFPVLHQIDDSGRLAPVPHGELPTMHSFRLTVASRALLAGESVDEVAFLLGHRDANVTRAVYVRELADVRRRSMRRSRMVAEFSDILKP